MATDQGQGDDKSLLDRRFDLRQRSDGAYKARQSDERVSQRCGAHQVDCLRHLHHVVPALLPRHCHVSRVRDIVGKERATALRVCTNMDSGIYEVESNNSERNQEVIPPDDP